MLSAVILGGVTGCSEENETPDEAVNQPVVSNPALNDFIITSRRGTMVTVDAQTGQEQILLTFDNFIRPINIADYTNGFIVFPTNDNSVNAVDAVSGDFKWETPMLEYTSHRADISSTVCQDGTCYTSGAFGVIVAVNALDGEVQWHYTIDTEGTLDNLENAVYTPVVRGNRIYALSAALDDEPAYLHVLDKATGTLLTKRELPYNPTGEPTFDGDLLLVPAYDLLALNAETLETIWTFVSNRVGTPSVAGNRIAVQGIPPDDEFFSELYCLDRNTGEPIWQVDTGVRATWDPVIVGNQVIGVFEANPVAGFDDRNGRPFAVRLSDGSEVWSRRDIETVQSPTYANGRLFFHGSLISDGGIGLTCLDAASGEVLWLNDYFRDGSANPATMPPVVVAQNGNFGPSYYRGSPGD